MNLRTIFLTSAICSLAACATAPPAVVDKPQVLVEEKPVPVSCVDKSFPAAPPAFPDTRDARLAAPDPATDYNLLAAGAPLHLAWEKSLWDQVNACR